MNKSLVFTLLAAFSLTSVAKESNFLPQTATWSKDENGRGAWDGQAAVNSNGDWSLSIDLNVDGLMQVFGDEPDTSWGAYVGSDALGKSLFTVEGTGYRKLGSDAPWTKEEDVQTTFVMGWGNAWYKTLLGWLEPDNAVSQGLQMGVADKGQAPNTNTSTGQTGYDMGAVTDIKEAFDVYRFDTKIQNNENEWSLNENDRSATASTLDRIVENGSIKSADLTIVHSTEGAVDSSGSDTTMYLTIQFDNSDLVLRYMASINDESTTDSGAGTLLGGSAYYDVDIITNITNINSTLIDKIVIYDQAYPVNGMGQLVPEPASATLSMMALTALCARRRRRK